MIARYRSDCKVGVKAIETDGELQLTELARWHALLHISSSHQFVMHFCEGCWASSQCVENICKKPHSDSHAVGKECVELSSAKRGVCFCCFVLGSSEVILERLLWLPVHASMNSNVDYDHKLSRDQGRGISLSPWPPCFIVCDHLPLCSMTPQNIHISTMTV